MHRGWVKQWRKESESPIWDKPPVYCKVWLWMKMNADRDTGVVRRSFRGIGESVSWQDERHGTPRVPTPKTIGKVLRWMEEQGMVTITQRGTGNAQYAEVSICNWATYQQSDTVTGNTQESQRNHTERALQEVEVCCTPPPVPSSEPPERAPERVPFDTATVTVVDPGAPATDYVPTDPSYVLDPAYSGQAALDLWQARVGRLQPVHHLAALNAFQRLHQFHKRTPAQIVSLVEFIASDADARRFWGSNPAKLIATDGVERTYEKIEHRMASPGAPSRPQRETPTEQSARIKAMLRAKREKEANRAETV